MTNNILDVLTFMFDILFESAEQDSSQEVDDDLLKSHLSVSYTHLTLPTKA